MYRNIKFLREKHGLTLKELAEIMEISEKKLIGAESCADVGYLYDKHLRNICIYFNVSADTLLNEKFY